MNMIRHNYKCHNIIDISIQSINRISDDASASLTSQTAFTVACIKQTFMGGKTKSAMLREVEMA